jgi:hypothetical protein
LVGVGLYIGEEHRRRLRIDRKVILESKSRPTCHVAGENSMNFMICSLPHIGIIKERRGWADPIARTEGMINGRKSRLKNVKENTISIPRHRWEDNIEADLKEFGRDFVRCIHVFRDRNQRRSAMKSVIHFWIL